MFILLNLSLFLICVVVWKTHTGETWLRILQGKESFSRPLGDSYSGGQSERDRFFPPTYADLQHVWVNLKCQSSKAYVVILDFWLWLLGRDSLTRSGFGSCLVILFYFIGKQRQAMLADLPSDLWKLCNSITHYTTKGFFSLTQSSQLSSASGQFLF